MPGIRKTTIATGLLVVLSSTARADIADAMLRVQGGWEKVDAGRLLKPEFRFVNDLVAYGRNRARAV